MKPFNDLKGGVNSKPLTREEIVFIINDIKALHGIIEELLPETDTKNLRKRDRNIINKLNHMANSLVFSGESLLITNKKKSYDFCPKHGYYDCTCIKTNS